MKLNSYSFDALVNFLDNKLENQKFLEVESMCNMIKNNFDNTL